MSPDELLALPQLTLPRCAAVRGTVTPPASKSLTQRYLNLALLARQPLVVERPLEAEDSELFQGVLEVCGFRVWREPGRVEVEPEASLPTEAEVFCGPNGTLFRFVTAALTAIPGRWRVDGVPRLRERPVGPLVAALRQLGAEITYLEREGFAPLAIRGGSLQGGSATLDAGESSQYLSALVQACLRAREPVTVTVTALASAPYLDLTLDAIEAFGGQVRWDGTTMHIEPGLAPPAAVRVEGDDSAAAYPAAAAALLEGPVRIEGLNPASRQGDRGFLAVLERMGASVRWRADGAVEIRGGALRGVTEDLSAMPDQVPTLAALAPFARGVTRIEKVPHLRLKESDRLAAMAEELGRLGVPVEELPDGLVIPGVWAEGVPVGLPPVTVATHGDHRIAMSLALVALRRGAVTVAAPGVVAKSYPLFWRDLETLYGSRAG
jgi:3-phosphoshikimate 1-carboxyvinyltransferase